MIRVDKKTKNTEKQKQENIQTNRRERLNFNPKPKQLILLNKVQNKHYFLNEAYNMYIVLSLKSKGKTYLLSLISGKPYF